MSAVEFNGWLDYFGRYGRMHPVRMFDEGPALLASMVVNAVGGKVKPQDFLRTHAAVEPDLATDAAAVMRELMGGRP